MFDINHYCANDRRANISDITDRLVFCLAMYPGKLDWPFWYAWLDRTGEIYFRKGLKCRSKFTFCLKIVTTLLIMLTLFFLIVTGIKIKLNDAYDTRYKRENSALRIEVEFLRNPNSY